MIPKSMLVNIARENGLYVDAIKKCDNIAELELSEEPLKFLPNSILAVVRKFADAYWFGFESKSLFNLISASEIHSFDANFSLPKKSKYKVDAKSHVFMVDDNTVDLALKLSSQHKEDVDYPVIGVLNFANQNTPGGGYTKGAMAQEEELCRCTTLYTSLKDKVAKNYYDEKINKEKYQVLFSQTNSIPPSFPLSSVSAFGSARHLAMVQNRHPFPVRVKLPSVFPYSTSAAPVSEQLPGQTAADWEVPSPLSALPPSSPDIPMLLLSFPTVNKSLQTGLHLCRLPRGK